MCMFEPSSFCCPSDPTFSHLLRLQEPDSSFAFDFEALLDVGIPYKFLMALISGFSTY